MSLKATEGITSRFFGKLKFNDIFIVTVTENFKQKLLVVLQKFGSTPSTYKNDNAIGNTSVYNE